MDERLEKAFRQLVNTVCSDVDTQTAIMNGTFVDNNEPIIYQKKTAKFSSLYAEVLHEQKLMVDCSLSVSEKTEIRSVAVGIVANRHGLTKSELGRKLRRRS